MSLSQDERVHRIIGILQGKKGLDILLMDLRRLTDTVDFFILCSGTSDQHVKALSDELAEKLEAAGDPPWHLEGGDTWRWVLIDCVDIVVHVFRREIRDFYALERLWGDAACTAIDDAWEPPAGIPAAADGDLAVSRSWRS
jgi:ribosome-associated protein